MTFEAAKKIAFTYGREWNRCTEWTDAFIFSVKDHIGFGGMLSPIVILKEGGHAVTMSWYTCQENGAEMIREFDI